MKRIIFLAVGLILLVSSVANAEVLGRKVFAMSGEFIEFIPFSFTVPSGNCNNVRVFEYEQGNNYPTKTVAHWQELTPGTQVKSYSIGVFKFIVDGTVCSSEFIVEGELFDMDIYGVWSGIEVEPEDLGLLVKGGGVSRNYFRLSIDDSQYSYEIVFVPYGRKYTLNGLIADANSGNFGIQPSGADLAGVIIPDERGYLSRLVMFSDGKRSARIKEQTGNTIMQDDQVVVLIYKENY